ncbi:regulatory-associated protein of TOR 1-like [Humulus lupulus]|uniref:regulatory-associated protein of TOR 1-like n=1 Tax=Humulus lupulus TaxID=3486 RepID=UPI002B403A9A|nr:regulatory-associated protein of TOR 1-like [Humulus lupulus]
MTKRREQKFPQKKKDSNTNKPIINRLLLEDDTALDNHSSKYRSIIKEFCAFLCECKDVLDEATTMKLLESYGRVEESMFFANLKEQYEILIHHFIQLHDWVASSSSGSTRDCILLGACEAHETLPQSAEFPADVFTSCLTTPIKMALRWFCRRSLLHESLYESLIDKIPGHQNDRKTLLGGIKLDFHYSD